MLRVCNEWRKHLYRKDITKFISLYADNCSVSVNHRKNYQLSKNRIAVYDNFKDFFTEDKTVYVKNFYSTVNNEYLYVTGKCEMRINDEQLDSYHLILFEKRNLYGYYPHVDRETIKNSENIFKIKHHHIDFDV